MATVFVTRALPGDALERLRAAHEVRVWDGALPPGPAELREALADVEGLLCLLTERIDAELLELDAAPRLRAIANYAVGTDNIDLAAARARGIAVGVTPDVLTEATADLAFALLLAAARRLPEAAAAAREGWWRTWEPAGWLGAEVDGAALGIVGFGRIGRAVARRAEGFRMTVRSTADTPLEELLAASDFVTLHCPLTPQTRHLIDAAALARMRRSAILVNTARGAVVDQGALIAALRAGEIAAAAIDVTDPEPPPPGDPIFDAPNLLIVPHIGSATHAARARMTELAVENLLSALDGRAMPHPAGG
jgi:glyoxylate reductase